MILTPAIIAGLKEQATKAANKRSRLILHKEGDPYSDMLICLRHGSYVRCHRHPKPESYAVLEGELMVSFPGDGAVAILKAPNFARIEAGTWHQPAAITEWAIYHEVYSAPFVKEKDVEYAEWAKAE